MVFNQSKKDLMNAAAVGGGAAVAGLLLAYGSSQVVGRAMIASGRFYDEPRLFSCIRERPMSSAAVLAASALVGKQVERLVFRQ